MSVTDGDQTAGIGRPRRRRGRPFAIISAAMFPVIGLILLILGIVGLHNHQVLVTQGVPVLAQVSATSGYGRNTVQVSYPVRGRPTKGTINVGEGTYQVGEPVAVVYDPRSPEVVAAQASLGSASSAWSEIGTGCFFLAMVPLSVLFSFLTGRSARRRRAAGSSASG
jgi:Protein of unknown function (DUF3592)